MQRQKNKPEVIDLSNESLTKVLEGLQYTKGVRSDQVFESVDTKQLKNKSLLLYLILVVGDSRLTLNGFSYSFGRRSIERANPKMSFPKQSRWSILKSK